MLICAPGSAPGLRLEDLAAASFVCLEPGSRLAQMLREACAAAGFNPRIDYEVPEPRMIRGFVSAGLGAALIARSLVDEPGAPVDVHDVPGLPEHPPLGLMHLAGALRRPGVLLLREQLLRGLGPVPDTH